jgi:O-antigen/teichoic acid export membrane protein
VTQLGLKSPSSNDSRTLLSSVPAGPHPASHSSLVLFTLKGLNFALTAVSNFVLAYVLVRTIGVESYAVIASLLAVAALVLQTDLGITGLAFFQLRSHYLTEAGKSEATRNDRDLTATIITIYISVALVSIMLLGITLAAGLVNVGPYSVAYVLLFAGAVSALPRMALRVAVNAREGFVWTEIVDLGRRSGILGATIAMLLGLSFVWYSVLNLLAWLSSIAALIWLTRIYGFSPDRGWLLRGLRLLRPELRGIRATVLLSLADFIIAVFPYYLLAAMRNATAIVAFDMFYKVTRFAIMGYLIGAETALPHQTRAVHKKDATRLASITAKAVVVGLFPMLAGIVVIAFFGENMFAIILNHDEIVSPLMRLAICSMLAFGLIQTTCQIVLIGVGQFEELARRAGITFAGMVLISALTILFHWSMDAFMIGYVIVYGAGSLLYAECFYSLCRTLRSQHTIARRRTRSNP